MTNKRPWHLWAIALFILFWVCWFMESYAWINFADTVADLLWIMLFIILILMIISGFGVLYSLFKKRKSINKTKEITTILGFVILVALQLGLLYSFYGGGMQVSGLTSIVSKTNNSETYSFAIKHSNSQETVTFKCEKDTFDDLIIDKDVLYTISYRFYSYNKNHGVLEYIDTKDVIDNRH